MVERRSSPSPFIAVTGARGPATELRAQPVPTGTTQDTLAIERVTVLPMHRDTALTDHTVIVVRERIVWVGPSRNARVPRGARRVDGTGTDASIPPFRPGAALHCELGTLVAAGLPRCEALVAATRDAGEFARVHLKEQVPFGTVTVGARADLLLLSADPRADISAVANHRGIVWRPR